MAEHEQHEEHGGEEHKEHKKHGGHHGGHGGGHEEHAGAPEWLISFADNVALLMGFFVILLAMNMGPKGAGAASDPAKQDEFTESENMLALRSGFAEAFNTPVSENDPNPKIRELARYRKWRDAKGTENTPMPKGKADKPQTIPNAGQVIDVVGRIGFDTNSAEVSSAWMDDIRRFVHEVRGQTWIIEVRGHVSASEAHRAPVAAPKPGVVRLTGADRRADALGYQLSFQRAVAVQQLLVAEGLDPRQVRVVACADHERAEPRAGDDGQHRANQRVEIIRTREAMPPDFYSADPGAAR